MIDTHSHIDAEAFDNDRTEVIDRAFIEGVKEIIIPAIHSNGFKKIINIADNEDRIYCALGIHPHHSHEAVESDFDLIHDLSANKKVVAIGEIGLDYYYDFSPAETQKKIFSKQLNLAKELNLPVIIHNREADDDIFSMLNEEQNGNLRGVLHCFSSSVEFMQKALDIGFYISFTGNITFKKSNLSEIVYAAPNDKILLETDSPYMTPVPLRGKRNEPAYIQYIAKKISEIKQITFEEVISMTTNNVKTLFKILILILILTFSVNSLFSQKSDNNPPDYPSMKLLGFGIFGGVNTVVQTQFLTNGQPSISYEGIPAYGGSIQVGALDYLSLEIAYCYSKNTKIAEKNDYLVDPTIYNIFHFSTRWIANPFNRINYYGVGGLALYFNSVNKNKVSKIGFDFGIGFSINIPVSSIGLFNLNLEWRLDFPLGQDDNVYLNDSKELQKIKTSDYYSIPRMFIIYYPKL